MLLLVAVRVCASLYAYWCQADELTPPKWPKLCDMKKVQHVITSDGSCMCVSVCLLVSG